MCFLDGDMLSWPFLPRRDDIIVVVVVVEEEGERGRGMINLVVIVNPEFSSSSSSLTNDNLRRGVRLDECTCSISFLIAIPLLRPCTCLIALVLVLHASSCNNPPGNDDDGRRNTPDDTINAGIADDQRR